MAELWYYTCAGKQMDPVTTAELRRLVSDGVLKPTDMVWKEGMPRWIRASSAKEIFPDPATLLDNLIPSAPAVVPVAPVPPVKPVVPAVPVVTVQPIPLTESPPAEKPRPTSKKTAPPADDEPRPKKRRVVADDADEADRPRRRRPARSSGGSAGLIVALCVGGGILLVVFVVAGIAILLSHTRARPPVGPGPVVNNPNPVVNNPPPVNLAPFNPITYTVNLLPGRTHTNGVNLPDGERYEITVRTIQRVPDVDLFIFDPNGQQIASDILVSPDARCEVQSVPGGGNFRVMVKNLGPGQARSTVTVRRLDPPQGRAEVPIPEPPAGVKALGGKTVGGPLLPGKDFELKVQIPQGRTATLRVTALGAASKTGDLNLYLVRDRDNVQVDADTGPLPHALIVFPAAQTEVYRVRVHNAGQNPARFSLSYTSKS